MSQRKREKKRIKKVPQLKSLAKDVICRKYSKMATNIIVSTHEFLSHALPQWRANAIFKDGMLITGSAFVTKEYLWYSQPEVIKDTGDLCFSILDPHHLFVNCRSCVCSNGLKG